MSQDWHFSVFYPLETSMQIYGGGSGFYENDKDSSKGGASNNGMLPRRMKQPTTTIHSKPTVNAVDDFEEDIEEVILN